MRRRGGEAGYLDCEIERGEEVKKAKISYIIKSGDGFLVELGNQTPEMTSDPIEATRFGFQSAANLQRLELSRLGFSSQLVRVRKALHLGQGES